MPRDTTAAARVTEIVALLRPPRPRRFQESLAGAAAEGDLERMQLFLDRGASVEQRSMGQTPLGVACAHGQAEAVRWLIAHGALLDPPDVLHSPITSALSKANCQVAALLLDAGLPIDRAAWGAVAAAAMGRLDVLRWLVGRGLDLDASYPRLGVLRARALRDVRKEGGDEVARFLEGRPDPGPPPAAPPATTPFRQESPRAAPEARDALLQEALDVVHAAGKAAAQWDATGTAAPPQRQRLISFAAAAGVAEVVSALLDAGASPNAVPDGTPPPLIAAAGEAQVDVVRLLLDRGALPNGPDGRRWVPLTGAAQSGDPEVVRVLLAAGANPKARPAGGQTLVDYARGPFAPEIRAMLEHAAGSKGGGKPARAR